MSVDYKISRLVEHDDGSTTAVVRFYRGQSKLITLPEEQRLKGVAKEQRYVRSALLSEEIVENVSKDSIRQVLKSNLRQKGQPIPEQDD